VSALRERVTVHRAVAALVVLAFAVRAPLLGARVAHWDEARVAWWTLRYAETGAYRYYPILHGPLLPLVTRPLLETFGRSDAVLRLPTAVVGGLLPAVALLYRDPPWRPSTGAGSTDGDARANWSGLDDRETAALAGLLAFAPLLVFYSRFFRNDLLVGAFSLAAFGCLLRARTLDRARRAGVLAAPAPPLPRRSSAYVAAAGALLGLGLGAKENALLYGLSWVGAAALLWAAGRGLAGEDRPGLAAGGRELAGRLGAGARRWWPDALGGTAAFVVVVVAVFAPRTGDADTGVGALPGQPSAWPAVVGEATLGTARRLAEVWVAGGVGGGPYPRFLGLLVGVTVATAAATVALAAVGLVAEHRADRRSLVGFAALWAGLGVVGYPLAADLIAGWTAVHVVVPLTIPAAVGLVALADRARPALPGRAGTGAEADRPARLAAVGLLAVGLYVGGVGGVAVFGAPAAAYNPYPQPAQPEADLAPAMDAVGAAVAHGGGAGPEAAYVGPHYRTGLPERLPVAWYVRAAGGTSVVRSTESPFPDGAPPVVVTLERGGPLVAGELSGYACWRGDATAWVDREPGGADTLVYVDRSALPETHAVRGTNCGPEVRTG